ncbi:hypothetical protein V2J09_020404 [Rumex salicifolius]
MMFTPTNYQDDQISFMDSYPSLLSPFTYFEIDGYNSNLPYSYCHDESILMSLSSSGNIIPDVDQSSNNNEPIISASSRMDVTYQGDIINGIVEQDHNSTSCVNNNSINNNINNSSNNKVGSARKQISCKKRTSKGDRHSKIPTAKGLRDRRMRLSLEVARQFFTLQDLLSYDKPSQTVKWLLLQAKSAIEEIKEDKQISPESADYGIKGASPNSELGEEVVENAIHEKSVIIANDMAPKAKEKAKKMMKKKSFDGEAKEMRKRARERARERTQKKKDGNISDQRRCVDMRPSFDLLNYNKVDQQIEANPEDYAVANANWSQLMSLNYHQEDQTFQMKSIPEFQFHGGSWEPYSYAQY